MAALSISKAWNETMEFMQRESRLVLPIAFLLISLPGAMLQYAMPTPQQGASIDLEVWMRDIRTVLLFVPFVVILSLIGTIAISFLAITPGKSVAEALQVGARRFIFLFLAWMIVGVAAAIALAPMFLLVQIQAVGQAPGGLFLLLILIYCLLCIAAAIRLLLATPVCAAETVGPIGILLRSWALTKGHFWKLLGFALLFWIAALVATMAISVVVGIIIALAAGPPVPGSTGAFIVLLVTAVLQAIVTCFFATMVARIYVQLAGKGQEAVFA